MSKAAFVSPLSARCWRHQLFTLVTLVLVSWPGCILPIRGESDSVEVDCQGEFLNGTASSSRSIPDSTNRTTRVAESLYRLSSYAKRESATGRRRNGEGKQKSEINRKKGGHLGKITAEGDANDNDNSGDSDKERLLQELLNIRNRFVVRYKVSEPFSMAVPDAADYEEVTAVTETFLAQYLEEDSNQNGGSYEGLILTMAAPTSETKTFEKETSEMYNINFLAIVELRYEPGGDQSFVDVPKVVTSALETDYFSAMYYLLELGGMKPTNPFRKTTSVIVIPVDLFNDFDDERIVVTEPEQKGHLPEEHQYHDKNPGGNEAEGVPERKEHVAKEPPDFSGSNDSRPKISDSNDIDGDYGGLEPPSTPSTPFKGGVESMPGPTRRPSPEIDYWKGTYINDGDDGGNGNRPPRPPNRPPSNVPGGGGPSGPGSSGPFPPGAQQPSVENSPSFGTKDPTVAPSVSLEPTAPTVSPMPSTSTEPTESPSASPSSSLSPTTTPFPSISTKPSVSDVPSSSPSKSPKPSASISPSAEPSIAPTEGPKCLTVANVDFCDQRTKDNIQMNKFPPKRGCDCYNFCDREYIGCCEYEEECKIDCLGFLVAGCEVSTE